MTRLAGSASAGLTFVLVDAPASEHFTVMPGLDCVTNPALGYFRFHGRNEQGYIRGRSVAERFDYDYSDEEVKELAERIRKVALEVEELRVIANNNRSNYAPRLVARLAKLLNLERELQAELEEKQRRESGNNSKRYSNFQIQSALTFRFCKLPVLAGPPSNRSTKSSYLLRVY